MSKTVLITGGTRGIGKAAVKLFSDNGYDVAFIYKNSDAQAIALSSSLSASSKVIAYKCDISLFDDVEKTVSHILADFGKIDVLVNSAGIAEQKLFTDLSEKNWDDMLDTNLKGVFNVTRFVLPSMIREKNGTVINVSSMWGLTGASCEVHYSAAKAGVIGLTKALAKEVAPSGIRVNCIAPGIIDTDMNAHLSKEETDAFVNEIPISRMGTPEEVAGLIYFLSSDAAAYITGQVISQDGGLTI